LVDLASHVLADKRGSGRGWVGAGVASTSRPTSRVSRVSRASRASRVYTEHEHEHDFEHGHGPASYTQSYSHLDTYSNAPSYSQAYNHPDTSFRSRSWSRPRSPSRSFISQTGSGSEKSFGMCFHIDDLCDLPNVHNETNLIILVLLSQMQ
jgi:hypothetical protein